MVQWQEHLAIGVLEVDIQHKLLFEKFNAFLTACESGAEREGIFQLFWFLQAYAVTHFKDEEQLMQRIGYPGFQAHRERHLEFAAQVGALAEQLKQQGPTEPQVATMRNFIANWLIEHISRMDRAIGDFMATSGAR